MTITKVSQWRCPQCKQRLVLMSSAVYRCQDCGKDYEGDFIDPLFRDFERVQLINAMALERAGIV
jgi:DNA-directed RNA polymerase subunit RPC12/RpoP